ncbi:PAS domain S-box protein [Sulfuricurvum sp.]|uniref:PAS domain S-box protein n=1 Tax=Sulfuricurvum sp. TaxID=2025608 RepID=UPI003BB56B6F
MAYLVSQHIRQMQIENNQLYLQSRNTAIGETIAHIAHQWKQPLNAVASIQNNIKALLQYKIKISEDELYDAVDNSSRLLHHIGSTIDTFYGFLTHHNDNKKSFLLKEQIETVLKLIEYDFKNTNVKLSIDGDTQAIIMGNANEFIHVILNIILNAKEAFEQVEVESAEIRIIIKESDDQCLITIADNAGGIRIEPIKLIFNRYVSGKNGTGLGLYMAREIVVNRFGGEITVENKDKGAVFSILLPSRPVNTLVIPTREQDLEQIQNLTRQILDLEKVKNDLSRWAEIFTHAQWAIMVHLGESDIFEHVNPAFYALYGYSSEELKYLRVRDLFVPEALESLAEFSSKAFETGYIIFESIHCRKDRTRFPVSIELIVIKNDEGELLYHIANVWDLSEKKESAKKLHLVTTAINSTDEAVYINDVNLSIIYVNESASKMLGYSSDELRELSIGDIDANYSNEELIEFRKTLHMNCSTTFETQHKMKSGEVIDVEIVANLFEFEGQHIGLSIVKNITERKYAQEQLLKSAEEYRTIVENSNDNIVRYDKYGRIHYMNPTLEMTLGVSLDDVIGKTPTEIWGQEYDEFEQILHRVIAIGSDEKYNFKFTGSNGTTEIHQIHFIAECDRKDTISGVLVIGRDITEIANL